MVLPMSDEGMLKVKQAIARMNEAERLEVSSYLLKLRHEGSAWRKEAGKTMRAMDRGEKVSLKDLSKRLGHA
jgi:hypothetical protein